MNLIYVNELGPNYKGDNIYEFIFSDIDDVWGEDWDATPSGGKPLPPQIEFIKKVGVLRNSEIELELIQQSDYFGVYDAVDGVSGLAWDKSDGGDSIGKGEKKGEVNEGSISPTFFFKNVVSLSCA